MKSNSIVQASNVIKFELKELSTASPEAPWLPLAQVLLFDQQHN